MSERWLSDAELDALEKQVRRADAANEYIKQDIRDAGMEIVDEHPDWLEKRLALVAAARWANQARAWLAQFEPVVLHEAECPCGNDEDASRCTCGLAELLAALPGVKG